MIKTEVFIVLATDFAKIGAVSTYPIAAYKSKGDAGIEAERLGQRPVGENVHKRVVSIVNADYYE